MWNKIAGTVVIPGKSQAETVTLDQIESLLLNPPNDVIYIIHSNLHFQWKIDPRVLTAIVDTSISSPNLRAEAYTAEQLDEQLTDNFNSFLNNPKKGMKINTNSNIVTVSSIFDWFGNNFTNYVGGDATIIDYIVLYYANSSSPTNYQWLKTHKNPTVEFIAYDWYLNAKDGEIPCDHAAYVF